MTVARRVRRFEREPSVPGPVHPTPRAELWRQLYQESPERASEACDRIVRSKPAPDALRMALALGRRVSPREAPRPPEAF